MSNKVFVWLALGSQNIYLGTLWFHARKGRESASFEYDKQWLEHPERFALDPLLQLTVGTFHTKNDKSLFGAMGDSSPDRWGRVLMRRAENATARDEKRTVKTLTEIDYLLGVYDEARQGALRFSCEAENPLFLAAPEVNAIPPLLYLPELLAATDRFIDDHESSDDLKLLLAPGSSLGGARPKASIRDQKGNLAIAKFPRKDDDFNVVAWEAVALTLAKNAGIRVPPWRLEKMSEKSVLIIQRFDRQQQERIPFLSAMSMLGAQDNEQHSYLELVDALLQQSADAEKDMHELWRRIVFTIMISNTDDHLRNHGFLYERQKGWSLSPAYDMNPTPREVKPRVLTMAINFDNTFASLETASSVAEDFRLSKNQAEQIIKEVAFSVKRWKEVATDFGLLKREIDRMASAFEHEDGHAVFK